MTQPIRIRQLARPEPWRSYLLEVSQFPVPADEKAGMAPLLWDLVSEHARRTRTLLETYVLVNELHQGDSAAVLAANGARWIPRIGLAIWPDRPLPGLWTREMVEQLRVGENPPASFYQIMQVTASRQAREDAFRSMTGYGALIAVLTGLETDPFVEACRQVIFPMLTPPVYTAFPMYLPLFDLQTLGAQSSDLERWSCGAELYVRELHHDKGVLLLSRGPLDSTFAAVGATARGAGLWEISR
jgi:hypothetical protein